MAYTPINWQTGDTITADKLNKMDNGWGYESTQLFSETVTTAIDPEYQDSPPYAQLAYMSRITADTITVTFDGTEYTCPLLGNGAYGAPFSKGAYDFSVYPFNLVSDEGTYINTQTAGEHTVAVSVSTLQTSADFTAAIKAAIDLSMLPLRCVEGVTTITEASKAMKDGRLIYFTAPEDSYEGAVNHGFLISGVSTTCTIVPTSTKIAAKFGRDSGLFYIARLSS